MDLDGERRGRDINRLHLHLADLIKLSVGEPDFKELSVTIGNTPFPHGVFLTAPVSFLFQQRSWR